MVEREHLKYDLSNRLTPSCAKTQPDDVLRPEMIRKGPALWIFAVN